MPRLKSEGALSMYDGGPARLYEGWVKEHEARFKQAGLDARPAAGVRHHAGRPVLCRAKTAYEPARFVDESYLAESRR